MMNAQEDWFVAKQVGELGEILTYSGAPMTQEQAVKLVTELTEASINEEDTVFFAYQMGKTIQ